jgi:RHS repeat-associated protein
VTTVNTFYENTDLVKESRTYAPNLGVTRSMAIQTAWVLTQYDLEGRPRFLSRGSVPDTAGIDTITTEFRYDFAGRKRAEVAPDGKKDSTRYDLAGNPVTVWTRRGHRIDMEYDSLNRLTKRIVPEAKYGRDARGIPGSSTIPPACSSGEPPDNIYPFYPYYPTDRADCSLTLQAEAHEFGYDDDGNLVRADNSVSRVRRRYRLNGTLELDSLYIRTLDGQPNDPAAFTPHAYGMGHEHDLNGRRVSLSHPRQLAPVENAVTRYSYDPRTGGLASVTDPLVNRFTFQYDVHGQLERVERPGGVVHGYSYDRDGRLELASLDLPAAAGGRLANTHFTYDARGKLLRADNVVMIEDSMRAWYSGLGHLVRERRRVRGQDQSGSSVEHLNDGDYAYDALGNSTLMRTREVTKLQGADKPVSDKPNGGRATYQEGTGRQLVQERTGSDTVTTVFLYDSAGNQDHQLRTSGSIPNLERTDRVLYYGADNVLRAVERRSVRGIGGGQGSFEEYRYDALGRRIWVRTRNWCESQVQDGTCLFHTQERTVWDGDQALYEIQLSDSEAGNDTTPPHVARLGNGTYDPNPRIGRVLLTHGPGIDQPLSVIRMRYREWHDHPGPWNTFAVIPLWDTEGRASRMLFSNGARNTAPSFAPGGMRQLKTLWRLGRDAYGPSSNAAVLSSEGPEVWMDGVIADQQDASGLLYRRNRYYDPSTGRFTQEDPIGLAGGLNLYGFANGDPVSYSDPYGLCPGIPRTDQWNLLDCPRGWITAGLTTFGGGAGGIGGGITGGLAGGAACSWSGPGALVCAGGGAAAGAKSGAATGAAAGFLLGTAVEFGIVLANGLNGEGGDEDDNRQFKPLTAGEIRRLQRGDIDPHDLKPNSRWDLFKDKAGNIYTRLKRGGEAEETGLNINDF